MRLYITPKITSTPGQTRDPRRCETPVRLTMVLSLSSWCGAKSTFPSHMMPLSVEKREACAGGVGEGGRGMPVR